MARRFPPPWSLEELNDACFVVIDSAGQKLASRATKRGGSVWDNHSNFACGAFSSAACLNPPFSCGGNFRQLAIKHVRDSGGVNEPCGGGPSGLQ
jgi:hypothetical protein